MSSSSPASSWINAERSRQSFSVDGIALIDSREWSLVDGVVRHETGRFFELRGIEWQDSKGNLVCSPFVNQPEVGILGIAVAWQNGERRILLDAKFEPGNVLGVDVAPSFQATRSNFERAHGGTAPALSEEFLAQSNWHSHVKQSEQGTRFIRKWNENVVLELGEPCEITASMRWCSSRDVLALLHASHTLNTDARSVIATADWDLWLDAKSPRTDTLASRLSNAVRDTLQVPVGSDLTERATTTLSDWAARHSFTYREVPLYAEADVVGVDSLGHPTHVDVTHVLVSTDSRERRAWDQPLVGNPQPSEEILFGTMDSDGIPRFFFTPLTEVGLAHAQFGNSMSSADAGRAHPLVFSDPLSMGLLRASTPLVTISQSDEGGRFHRQVVTYSLRWLDNTNMASAIAPDGQWLSPAEIRHLVRQPGFFTNEARTTISLIVGLL